VVLWSFVMRRALAIALVGCSFNPPSGNGGRDATPIDARPDSPPPIDAAPDAPPDVLPVPDVDGDGIPNTTDNCLVVPNPDQRNFDGDPKGDACDLCPHLASDLDPDVDGDQVGDACDPRPSDNGDTRVLWEDFQDADALDNWTLTDGAWALSNGRLVQTDTAPVAAIASPPLTVPRAYVATRFRVGTLGSASGDKEPGYGVSGGYGGGQYYACIVVDSGIPNYLVAGSAWSGHSPSFQANLWFGPFGAGDAIELVHSSAITNNCFARAGNTTQNASDAIGPTGGSVILYTQRAAGEFDYMFVVSIP
jgi:hypothetical protein